MKTFSFVLGTLLLWSPFLAFAENDSRPDNPLTEPETAQVQMMKGMEVGKMNPEMMKDGMDSNMMNMMDSSKMRDMMTPEMMQMMKSPMHQKMMDNLNSKPNTWEYHHFRAGGWNMGWHLLMTICALAFLAAATFIVRRVWDAAGKK